MQAVLDFRVDIGFIEGPCHSTEIISEPWLEDELVVFAAPTSPLARGPVTLEQLAAAPWICVNAAPARGDCRLSVAVTFTEV